MLLQQRSQRQRNYLLKKQPKPSNHQLDVVRAALAKNSRCFFGEIMRGILVIVMLLMSSVTAGAQGVMTNGGTMDCGKWLSARKSMTANYYEHYLLGIVDGLALGRWVDVWAGKGGQVTTEQFYYWMDAYCEKNPLDMTITGAVNFADEMSNGVFKKKAKK